MTMLQGRGMRWCNWLVRRWHAAAIDDILRDIAAVAVAGDLTDSVVPRAQGRGCIVLMTKHTTINHNNDVAREGKCWRNGWCCLWGGGYAAAEGDIARDVVAMTAARDQGSYWHSTPMGGDELSRQRNTTTNHDDDVAMKMNVALQGWTMRQTGVITSQKQCKSYLLKI
jgi:hypothetical protein